MSRPKSTKQPIVDPDTQNTDIRYWENVLNSHNLSTKRGLHLHLVTYRGTPKRLEDLEASQATDRVTPKGHGPDA